MSFFLFQQTNPYSLTKEAAGNAAGDAAAAAAWSAAAAAGPPGLHQSAPGYYPYDPTLAAYG